MVGRVDLVEPSHVAAKRTKQPELVQPAEAGGRETLELAEHALAGRFGHELRVAADERLGLLVQAEAELVLEPHRTEQPQRIRAEHAVGDRPQRLRAEIRDAAERIDRVGRPETPRDRIDGEVARGEVVRDRPAQRREVDRVPVPVRDAPGAVALREGHDRPALRARIRPRGRFGLGARHVDVEYGATEQLVPDHAANEVRLLPGRGQKRCVIHRRPSGPRARAACGCRTSPRS